MNALAVLKMLSEILAPLMMAYMEARRVAAQDGVSEADLAAADERWMRYRADPLGVVPPARET